MLGFELTKEEFVATSVAIGLIVDLARLPVYAWSQGGNAMHEAPLIGLMVVCVIAGTLLGKVLLARVREALFKRIVATIILALGVALLSYS